MSSSYSPLNGPFFSGALQPSLGQAYWQWSPHESYFHQTLPNPPPPISYNNHPGPSGLARSHTVASPHVQEAWWHQAPAKPQSEYQNHVASRPAPPNSTSYLASNRPPQFQNKPPPAAHRSTNTVATKLPPNRPNRPKCHICWACHKRFDRPSTLRKHFLVHTGEKPYSCNLCGRRFGIKSNLNRHRRRCEQYYDVHAPDTTPSDTPYVGITTQHPEETGPVADLGAQAGNKTFNSAAPPQTVVSSIANPSAMSHSIHQNTKITDAGEGPAIKKRAKRRGLTPSPPPFKFPEVADAHSSFHQIASVSFQDACLTFPPIPVPLDFTEHSRPYHDHTNSIWAHYS